MAHSCACQAGESETLDAADIAPLITANRTVRDVAHHYPGAHAVLRQMGINHCCGAHLSLAEAAAVAGVSSEALLQALNKATSATG